MFSAAADVQEEFNKLTMEEKEERLKSYIPTFYQVKKFSRFQDPLSMDILNLILIQEELNTGLSNLLTLDTLEYLTEKLGVTKFEQVVCNKYMSSFIKGHFNESLILRAFDKREPRELVDTFVLNDFAHPEKGGRTVKVRSGWNKKDQKTLVFNFTRKITQVYILKYVRKYGFEKFSKAFDVDPIFLDFDLTGKIQNRLKEEDEKRSIQENDKKLRSLLVKEGIEDINLPNIYTSKFTSKKELKKVPDISETIKKVASILDNSRVKTLLMNKSNYAEKCLNASASCKVLQEMTCKFKQIYDECFQSIRLEGSLNPALHDDLKAAVSKYASNINTVKDAMKKPCNSHIFTKDEIEEIETNRCVRIQKMIEFVNTAYGYNFMSINIL